MFFYCFVMRNLFNSVRLPAKKRNKFNLSFSNDFTTDFGDLVPCAVLECNAGEPFRISLESFIRTQPLRAPAFTSSDVSYHFFFVPNRLVFDDWTDFIVRGRNGDTDYIKPYATFNQITSSKTLSNFVVPGSLTDFLNFPTFNDSANLAADVAATDGDTRFDMMPFNAYNLIYNEYYRDENLTPEVFIWSQQGSTDNFTDLQQYCTDVSNEYGAQMILFPIPWLLRKRSWRKDYFTSALPFVQKGSPISLVGSVDPVSGNPWVPVQIQPSTWQIGDPTSWFIGFRSEDGSGSPTSWKPAVSSLTSFQSVPLSQIDTSNHYHSAPVYNSSNWTDLVAYISLPEMQTNVMSISDLRVALALQQWFELNARTGSDRYFEYLLGHFGVRDRDSRLQRPEYLGGFSHAIQISEVEQTSSTNNVTPQGNLAGRGLGYAHNSPILYRTPEPGFIMCIQSIRPRSVYFNGWPRMYQRWDAFDYYDPFFDHLSEQAIKKSELLWLPGTQPLSSGDGDFGYTPRFSEYRTHLNECHGDFRATLKYWLSPRDISSQMLNYDFITINGYSQKLYDMFAFPGTDAQPAPHFLCHLVFHIDAIRPMSKYATPYI